MAYKLDGKTLIMDRSFTHNEIQYPRNWLQLSSEEEKDAIGVTWEADPVRADDRYYWNGEIDNPKAMVNTPVRLVTKGLKSTKIAEVKAECDRLETAIAACTDVEGLIDVMQGASWTTL